MELLRYSPALIESQLRRADFDAVIVKSPHCQEHMFNAWAHRVVNVDADGSTSANLPRLGHTVCRRPIFPLDEQVEWAPMVQIYAR